MVTKGQWENMKCLPSAVTLSPFLSSLNPERNFLTPKQNLKKVNSLAQGLAVTRGRAGACSSG